MFTPDTAIVNSRLATYDASKIDAVNGNLFLHLPLYHRRNDEISLSEDYIDNPSLPDSARYHSPASILKVSRYSLPDCEDALTHDPVVTPYFS